MAFALVCQSHKTSSSISQREFDWVEEFVLKNSFHSEPSFRQQMISHLKHFLFHVLESQQKLDEARRQPYKVRQLPTYMLAGSFPLFIQSDIVSVAMLSTCCYLYRSSCVDLAPVRWRGCPLATPLPNVPWPSKY